MDEEAKKSIEAAIASTQDKIAGCDEAISEAKSQKKLLKKDMKKLQKLIGKG